jgi:hypothetical protein
MADEAALRHGCNHDVAVTAAKTNLQRTSNAKQEYCGDARVFFALSEVGDDCGVQDARGARADRVAHLNACGDERHARGIDASAANAAIDLRRDGGKTW